jgi:hypothetical protein
LELKSDSFSYRTQLHSIPKLQHYPQRRLYFFNPLFGHSAFGSSLESDRELYSLGCSELRNNLGVKVHPLLGQYFPYPFNARKKFGLDDLTIVARSARQSSSHLAGVVPDLCFPLTVYGLSLCVRCPVRGFRSPPEAN